MSTRGDIVALVTVLVILYSYPIAVADTVISTQSTEILEAGDFADESQWDITSTSGFTQNQALFTKGMVADGELSFTHLRPDNFAEYTSWASESVTGSTATFGEADGIYNFESGPDITMSGYSYTGLNSMLIENVSLVLHFSIPDALTQDEVNILLQNHGSDKLVSTYANTLGGVNRMVNPLVISLDDLVDWDWEKLEGTQFTIDYVSDNSGPDDSEVRVDAVGLKVKYHQPWYSFENSKAEHVVSEIESPVLDFGPYDGQTVGLDQKTCGLEPEGDGESYWVFDVEVPPEQRLGRIHVYGTGNHTIWILSDMVIDENGDVDENYSEVESGDLIEHPYFLQHIRIDVEDGCIAGARVDVNDPHLVVSGSIAGSALGLSSGSSDVRFAVGGELVHVEPMHIGEFSMAIPIGRILPESGERLEVGVGARFQWASDGTAETTVVHVNSISISGGYKVEWDRDPECLEMDDLHLDEDEGGIIIAMPARCTDDITAEENLNVSAQSSDDSILEASGEGHNLRLQPSEDAYGTTTVDVLVTDEAGNSWGGSFVVNIEPIPDPPYMEGLPLTVFIELGETLVIEPIISDPDTESLSITTSRSWAIVDEHGAISMTPVESGSQSIIISVSDGTTEVSQEMEVIVTAKPDLLVESAEVRIGGVASSSFVQGDVIEIVGFIRNEGRGAAYNVLFHCHLEGILVGSVSIAEIGPGGLKMVICDTQLIEAGGELEILVEVDGTDSVAETNESNNLMEFAISVESPEVPGEGSDYGSLAILISIGVIVASLALMQIGPRPIKEEFKRRK